MHVLSQCMAVSETSMQLSELESEQAVPADCSVGCSWSASQKWPRFDALSHAAPIRSDLSQSRSYTLNLRSGPAPLVKVMSRQYSHCGLGSFIFVSLSKVVPLNLMRTKGSWCGLGRLHAPWAQTRTTGALLIPGGAMLTVGEGRP